MRTAIVSILLSAAAITAATAPVRADLEAHLYEKPISTNRDANMNRTVGFGGASGGTAMGNSIVVSQEGRGNTLILNVTQTNSGDNYGRRTP